MQTGMNIGTVVSKESLEPLTDAIVRIMEAKADQETVRHAIDALTKMAKVEDVTIQHCVINGDRSVVIEMDDATLTTRPTNTTGFNVGDQ